VKLDFFDNMKDQYLKKPEGRGVFLSGVTMGMLASQQGESYGKKLNETPLFKQINWGKMTYRDLKRLMSRIPELTNAYNAKYSDLINALNAKAGEMIMNGEAKKLGVDGNFAFTTGFTNYRTFFWQAFKKENKEDEE